MSGERGAIHSTEAYALGKMLDHSSWKLPRNITPSDVDLTFDNYGTILYGELSRHQVEWRNIQTGQRRLYQGMIANSNHCAVLAKHSVDPSDGRPINSCTDIEGFQLMAWDCGRWFYSPIVLGNDNWQRLVETNWFTKPQSVRIRVIDVCKESA